jgi:hypothetical protein
MRDRDEWEPHLYDRLSSFGPYLIVRAECRRCGHTADVDPKFIARLPQDQYVALLSAKLACQRCAERERGGGVSIYVRKKPR